ncbi:hypothetical protein L3081_23035 [Colwellia sp. MSW7]|uniref:Uncharacterized protein n=1 Tax=Colwellia maritima TaxID=2912588 RepID=A0ABS9X653_9GAMM|nr:hypothetical protein [Colwellia maritima]MCI2285725.1 hypothetical protein [Colwellia maritima]
MLDLFYVTYRGPVFMWHENGQWLTVFVHFSIALSTASLYWIINKRAIAKRKNKINSGLKTAFVSTPCDLSDDKDHNNMNMTK